MRFAGQLAHAGLDGRADDSLDLVRQAVVLSTLLVRSACCYTEAGKPHQAVQLFGDVLAGGTLSKRYSGLFGARQAKALALGGEPYEAATVAATAVTVARKTRSERTMNVVVEVVRALDPWRNRPSVRMLIDILMP
ncbi:hypothetical protein [Nocardia sputorum]|uniref:Uncharacterized protein n=1 Tax=Nocardia sputorum TaxID=2984338 RepID=A0ABN6TXB9_9NOCA|nr:hypothetical protein [Nocardia sputorum]BDT97554.1 hypothetical protein IFM12276_05830 [Nocardia sputorum]